MGSGRYWKERGRKKIGGKKKKKEKKELSTEFEPGSTEGISADTLTIDTKGYRPIRLQ